MREPSLEIGIGGTCPFGIRGEMPSQGSQQEWGSFGSIAGDGLGKEWREMGHSVQWTSVY